MSAASTRSALRLSLVTASFALAATPAFAAIDPIAAAAIFDEARAICARDGGTLWGRTLCGPMLLLDPTDLSLVANQPDAGGALKPAGAVFTGVLPPSEIVANTTVEWSGTRWTEMLWPLPDDVDRRQVLIAHELFHRIQPDLKMARLDGDNRHLDTLEGRYLLQLEWRALAKALDAPHAVGRRTAIADALLFRHERYRLFPLAATEEGALESNEGVAEYTGVRLGLATPGARTRYAIRDLSAFVGSPTFVRSFAYATGPAYGLLLDRADPRWRGKLASGLRPDALLSSALRLTTSPSAAAVEARAVVYDDGTLRTGEVARDVEKQRHLATLRARFVDGPVLILPLQGASYQFNPQTLQPLGESGTVYPTLRLSADWGVLEVDGGALLDPRRKVATVTAAGIDRASVRGDGWRLTLKAGWTVDAGTRAGDLIVKQGADATR